jgi:hypothetical protein
VGRGYLGRHRLAEVALGVRPELSAQPVQPGPAERTELAPPVVPEVTMAPSRSLPAAPMVVGGARLAVVPVAASLDPLVDTVPHPVVKLFPMPVHEIHDAVFAGEDAERDEASLVDLAAAERHAPEYHGRHSA